MERLTPKDTAVLNLEDDLTAAHGMTVAVFDGPAPTFSEMRERVIDRIRFIPRYRQRLVEVPLDLQRPVWVNDPSFSIDFHLRHHALPTGNKRQSLDAMLGRSLARRLDRDKPLWELSMISGLPGRRWALISKIHYAVLDGVSGTDVLGLLSDDLDLPSGRRASLGEPLPSATELVTSAIADTALDPMESMRVGRRLVQTPWRVASSTLSALTRPHDADALGTAVGPHRRWIGAEVSLNDLRKVRNANECSITDVILAAVAGGITNHLETAGKPVPPSVTALVPLSVGAASGGLTGQIATVKAELPLRECQPVDCLRAIRDQTAKGAARTGAMAGEALRRQSDFVAPTILGQGVRSSMLSARDDRTIETAAINVPGPVEPFSVLGRTVEEVWPVIPLLGRIRIGFAVLSLGDRVFFGITADWDTSDDLTAAQRGIENTVSELLALT